MDCPKCAELRVELQERKKSEAQLREALRLKMLATKTTDGNDTFHDGFHNGLLAAIQMLDGLAAVAPPETPQP